MLVKSTQTITVKTHKITVKNVVSLYTRVHKKAAALVT